MISLTRESQQIEDYLRADDVVDYTHPLVQQLARDLETSGASEEERIRAAFELVRDRVHHSVDIQSERVTCTASEVLAAGEGLCFAKAHLLAALLRAQGIPAGFCYQRLTVGETAAHGHVVHGLVAVHLSESDQWIRLDARGNKPGVQANYAAGTDVLAFVARPEFGEIDYPTIYATPHAKVLAALRAHTNCVELCERHLPERL
jgi:transglutaminase-like putative cysteine protease